MNEYECVHTIPTPVMLLESMVGIGLLFHVHNAFVGLISALANEDNQ